MPSELDIKKILNQAKQNGLLNDDKYQKLLGLSDRLNPEQVKKLNSLFQEAVSKREVAKKKAIDEEKNILNRYLKKISYLATTLFKEISKEYQKIAGHQESVEAEAILKQIENT